MNPWPLVQLKDVLTQVQRPVVIDPNKVYHILGVLWYAKGLYTHASIKGSQIQNELYRVEQGDLVYHRAFAWKGSFAVVDDRSAGHCVTREFPCFTVDTNRLGVRYLGYYYSRPTVWNETLTNGLGGTPVVGDVFGEQNFLAMRVPLLPLEQQRHIVLRIKDMLAKIRAAETAGRQVVAESETLLRAAKQAIFGRVKEWLTVSLGQVADIQPGIQWNQATLQERTVRLPALRAHNLQDGYLNLERLGQISVRPREIQSWTLHPGDILFPLDMESDKLERVALWRGQIEHCLFDQHILRVRVQPEQLNPDYLLALIQSPCRKTNPRVINRQSLIKFPVFKPSLDKQRRVVAFLGDLQARSETIKQFQANTATELDAMQHAILDQAFQDTCGF